MKLRWLVLGCAACWGWQGRAAACSVVLPTKQSLECSSRDAQTHTSVAQAVLALDAVEIQRSRYAPPGQGDCGELGSTRLRFRLAGTKEWPADVGVLLTLREGQSGYFAPPLSTVAGTTGWLMLPQAGLVRLFGPDDPQAPLALRLEARAVDCSGALSGPVIVNIADPGRSTGGASAVGSNSGGDDSGSSDASAPQPAPVAAPEGVAGAGTELVQASRPAPVGASCAVCSVQGTARGHARSGLGLALGVLVLGALRRRSRCISPAP